MPDKQRHQANELRNEKNKRENHESKEGMTENFADNVAVQDAHGEDAEFSMSVHAAPSTPGLLGIHA